MLLDEEVELIKKYVTEKDYINGQNYRFDLFEYKNYFGYDSSYDFSVEDRFTYHRVRIIKMPQGNFRTYCSCRDFENHHSCVHLAAILFKFRKKIFKIKSEEEIMSESKKLFKSYTSEKNSQVKKQVFLETEIVNDGYEHGIKLKIGTTKFYSLNNKSNTFFAVYLSDKGEVDFGKNFIYNPKIHYFSDLDQQLIEFVYYNCAKNNKTFVINESNAKSFFYNFGKLRMLYNNSYLDGVKEGFPINVNLTKNEDKYVFNVEDVNSLLPFTSDYEYVSNDKEIFHLNKKMRSLLREFREQGIQKIIFKENDLDAFSHSILPIVKNKIVIDNAISNIIVSKEPVAKMYFDLNHNNITCNYKLNYDGNEINYFDKSDTILRDDEYEQVGINLLASCGFQFENKKIILNEIDKIGEFLETRINELTDKYEVFTSDKLKAINIFKKIGVTSSFHIGQDNIMHYEFSSDNVNSNELMDLLDSMRKKKRYYKLKNGDIVNLNDDNLKELESLTTDLELDSESGEIPKYRAIYLDSLRDSRYHIIKTDNLFDNFITKFNEYKNVDVEFTKKEDELLRSYQKIGVKWLYNIYKCDFGGILADEMGLGKTLQTIIFFRKVLLEDKDAKFLIVAPTSLLYNWYKEFEKFAPEISVSIFGQAKEIRHDSLEKSDATVFITSYGLLREDIEYYEKMIFKVAIIDEAQNIKNPFAGITKSVKKIKASTKFALTGTPIENSVLELWSIFDYIMPGFLASISNFKSKYKVSEMNEDEIKLVETLKAQVQPFILRRRKKDVLSDLPDKVENIVYIDLNETQRKLYMAEVKKTEERMESLISESGYSKARFEILVLLTRLRQICIDPHIIYENYNDESAKITYLINIIKEYIANDHKMLLFTSFKTALEIVRRELNNNNISNYTIDGSVSSINRQKLVDNFNSDGTNVFLIMLKSGGTGLNLTSADVVIHLDPWWNPQSENQATDRAHRIGQTKSVEVLKLITKGTIEEKIIDLQKKKKLLSDKLIESDETSEEMLSALSEKDIRNLLAYENKDE